MSKNIITGVKPTGASMHLGNLLGAILPFDRAAQGNNAAIFIADLHALTSVKNGDMMRAQSHELAIEYMAIHGLNTPITIFRQSDIVQIPKLNWVLANVTPFSLMRRAHSFKAFDQQREENYLSLIAGINDMNQLREYVADLQAQLDRRDEEFYSNLNMGVFNYPILMAADIIGYDIDAVPVGRDQIQHLEMARDIARAFNKTYGAEIFREPQAIIEESVAVLPGVDGRKMSKSYNNFIGVFDDEKTLKKRIMSIVTDSRWVDDIKDPETCNIFALIKVFGTPDRIAQIRTKYETANAGYGYGHAKLELLDILTEWLRPHRERRAALLDHPELVEAKLAEGARIMNARLDTKMKEVDRVVGF